MLSLTPSVLKECLNLQFEKRWRSIAIYVVLKQIFGKHQYEVFPNVSTPPDQQEVFEPVCRRYTSIGAATRS